MIVTSVPVPDFISSALANDRRPADDRERDERRRLAELLAFLGIEPGMIVADLMASRGYLSAALAEVVGPGGRVYAQNSAQLLARFKGGNPVAERGLANVVPVVCELEALELPQSGCDLVLASLFYHDSVWVGTDRAAMNAAVYRALRPGGCYCVVDHDAPAGSGVTLARSHHRIERATVIDEVCAAGFSLRDESALLANDGDPMTTPVFDKSIRDRTNRFVLRFAKPGGTVRGA